MNRQFKEAIGYYEEYIAKYDEGNRFNHDERRSRKLLLHKNEINRSLASIESELKRRQEIFNKTR